MKYLCKFLFFGIIAGLLFSFKPTDQTQSNITNQVPVSSKLAGKELVQSKGCTLCHHEINKVVGPSFTDISTTYKGDHNKLIKFFKGEAEPLNKGEEFSFMKPVVNQLKHMKEAEREAIATYILSLK